VKPSPTRADGLLHPLPLAAIVILALNDHWGKLHFPGIATGKLSDFAGLAFFPLLLQAGWEALGGAIRARTLVVACIATAVVFALVKTWGPAHAAYEYGLGALQWPFRLAWGAWNGVPAPYTPVALEADPTDLVALPAVGAAWWVGRRRGTG
jgi:hypothetical protein